MRAQTVDKFCLSDRPMKLRAEIPLPKAKSFNMGPLRVLRPIPICGLVIVLMNLWTDSGSKFLASVHRRWAAVRRPADSCWRWARLLCAELTTVYWPVWWKEQILWRPHVPTFHTPSLATPWTQTLSSYAWYHNVYWSRYCDFCHSYATYILRV